MTIKYKLSGNVDSDVELHQKILCATRLSNVYSGCQMCNISGNGYGYLVKTSSERRGGC